MNEENKLNLGSVGGNEVAVCKRCGKPQTQLWKPFCSVFCFEDDWDRN